MNYSNAIGQYNRGECRDECKSLFPSAKDAPLLMRCVDSCKSKCKSIGKCSYHPSRSSICQGLGLNSDCTAKVDGPSILAENVVKSSPATPTAQISNSVAEMSKAEDIKKRNIKIGITIAVVLTIGVVAYKLLKK